MELAESPDGLMAILQKPRRILLMVPAGKAVDSAIAHLEGHLDAADILIDGGNSFFLDTERRGAALAAKGLNYVGTGVSGGEQGALWGPSIMPGGQVEAWEALAPILRAIAAKAEDGAPCVEYMGPGGAGHFVKMVHNGIEYGDMQLIAEAYDLLSRGLGLTAKELHEIFDEWNQGELKSYLIEITAAVLATVDPDTGRPLVDVILDEAQQKGTGKWMSQNALDVGAAIPTINAAVESRIISAMKTERVSASRVLRGPTLQYSGDRQRLIDAVRDALYASKITSYAQGLGLLRVASAEYKYDLKPASIARIWRAGCIIRASLLGDIMSAFERDPALGNLLVDAAFRDAVDRRQASWRFVVQTAVGLGHPDAGVELVARVFRRLSQRTPAGQSDAGPAGLLRRAHLPPGRQTRRVSYGVVIPGGTIDARPRHPSDRRPRLRVPRRARPSPRSRHRAVPQSDGL